MAASSVLLALWAAASVLRAFAVCGGSLCSSASEAASAPEYQENDYFTLLQTSPLVQINLQTSEQREGGPRVPRPAKQVSSVPTTERTDWNYIIGLKLGSVVATITSFSFLVISLATACRGGPAKLEKAACGDKSWVEFSFPSRKRDVPKDDDAPSDVANLLMNLPPPQITSSTHRNSCASFAVPLTAAGRTPANSVNLAVIAKPVAWPLSIQLTKPPKRTTWTQMELRVDIMASADLPPLLRCFAPGRRSSSSNRHSSETSAWGGSIGDSSEDDAAQPWIEFFQGNNTSGAPVAVVMPEQESGVHVVKRKGYGSWEVHRSGPLGRVGMRWSVTAARSSDVVCTAAVHYNGPAAAIAAASVPVAARDALDVVRDDDEDEREDRVMHVSVHAGMSSHESTLLLACMLSMFIFRE